MLTQLKTATQDHHAQIERDLDLFRPDFDLSDYRRLLERFFGYYQPWEQAAEPQLRSAVPAFWSQRSKTGWLQSDLATFGYTTASLAALPQCSQIPQLNSLPQIAGSLYVLEGATLGGQILTRHFETVFGLSDSACAFFRSYGPEVGSRWREFGSFLETVSTLSADPEVVRSAITTFESLHHWLCRPEEASA